MLSHDSWPPSDSAFVPGDAEFRTISEAAPALVWVCSASGENIYFNRRWYDYTGHSAADSYGYGWATAMHPDDAARILPYWKRCQKTGEPYEGEVRYRRRDGVYRWHTFRALPRRNRDGHIEAWYGLSFDTDDAKRAQEIIRESEERLGLAMEIGQLASWDWDLRSGTINWNDRHFLMQGYAIGEVTPSFAAWVERVHPQDRDETVALIEKARDLRQPYSHVFRTLHPDGAIRWSAAHGRFFYDEHGAPYRMIGVMEDITERKRADAILRESEEWVSKLLTLMPAAVYTCDAEGRLTFFNTRAAQLWGRKPRLGDEQEKFCGSFRMWRPDGSLLRHEDCPMAEAVREGRSARNLEVAIERPDGSHIVANVNIDPLYDSGGKLCGAINVFADITERKRAEAALRDGEARQRVLVAELQHRTRNLIAVVQSIAAQTTRTADNLEDFDTEFRRRLGTLSRVQALLSRNDRERITIGMLVRMELDAVGAEEQDGRVRLKGPEVILRPAVVQTLALALHELATNAVKHGALAAERGELDIAWRLTGSDQAPRLLLTWVESGLALTPDRLSSTHRGYGRELIEQALPYSLGARTSFALEKSGVHCSVELPLNPPGAADHA